MTLRIPVTTEQLLAISRPIGIPRARWGGFQHLIYRLQNSVRDDGTVLEITRDDAEKVLAYSSESYGSGTYQSQLRPLAPVVQQALEALPPPTPSLFGADDV